MSDRRLPMHPRARQALVLGLSSLVCLGPVTGIPAIVVGRRVVIEIDQPPGRLEGRGTAYAGFVTGIVGTTVWLLALVLVPLVTLTVGR